MKRLERVGFIFLVAGLALFLVAFVILGLVPAMMTNKLDNQAMMPTEVPTEFAGDFKTAEEYRAGITKGRDLYIAEACWHCHSQYVRPVSNESLQYGPVSTAGEYQNALQLPQLFGTRRVGPDLIREAGVRTNDWHFAHLYNPRNVVPQSVMPSYRWYFETTPDGVLRPKKEAVALVAYLQWLGSWVKDRRDTIYTRDAIVMPPSE